MILLFDPNKASETHHILQHVFTSCNLHNTYRCARVVALPYHLCSANYELSKQNTPSLFPSPCEEFWGFLAKTLRKNKQGPFLWRYHLDAEIAKFSKFRFRRIRRPGEGGEGRNDNKTRVFSRTKLRNKEKTQFRDGLQHFQFNFAPLLCEPVTSPKLGKSLESRKLG